MRKSSTRLVLSVCFFCMLVVIIPTQSFGSIKSPEIEVDDLTDWSRVHSYSKSLSLETAANAADPSRVKRGGTSGESIVYRIDTPLRAFSVNTYYPSGKWYSPINFYVSSDGESYEKVTPRVYRDGSQITFEGRGFRWTARYLKIVFSGSDKDSSPSIGKVVLNGPSSVNASLESGNVPYGSMLRLIREEIGDTVYYTTDGTDPRYSKTRQHYSAPIEVVSDMSIRATAVNHSASGRSAASRVSSYKFVPDGSLEAAGGLDDPLDNFDLMASRSNMYVLTDNPGNYGGDSGRAVRTALKPGYLFYKTDYDLSSFGVSMYHYTRNTIEPPKFYASADGKSYTEVEAEGFPVGHAANWQKYVYEAASLPAGTRYLKIEVNGSEKAWTPQLSNVVLNRNTASVSVKTTRSSEAVKAELTTGSSGANIFYRMNDASSFKTYSEPLQLTDYTVLETYAVKKGKETSPIREYTINASKDIKVDKFGQMVASNFAGKVTSEAQLKADAEADAEYYGSLKPPTDRDEYGGLAGSAQKYGLKATGFFAIQQMGSRKVMTTPDGNLYFSLGVNGLTAHETYTMVAGREEQFEEVPSYQGVFRPAFIEGSGNYSYYVANKYLKTGTFPTEHAVYQEAADRLKNWGFNSAGGYSPEKYGPDSGLPYVKMLPLDSMDWAKIDGIQIFDIFAPDAEQLLDTAIAKAVEPYKNDPMLIGYFIGNEYDFHKFYSKVPALKGSEAAIKGRLIDRLEDKYQTVAAFNKAWGTKVSSFDQAKEAVLPLSTSAAWKDMDEFFEYYLETFYGTVSKLYRKYDPNHLLLGDRWITTPFHNEKFRTPMAEIEGKYVDVISINYYSYKIETDLFQDVYEKSGGKPIMITEFGYGTSEQGLAPLLPNSAANQFERGMRYRNYVEGMASLDYIVGAHLFNYVDQAGLGRYWQGIWGEHYNSGLVNVADRPYKQYLDGIMDTNYDIYKIMLKERPKFYYSFNKQ